MVSSKIILGALLAVVVAVTAVPHVLKHHHKSLGHNGKVGLSVSGHHSIHSRLRSCKKRDLFSLTGLFRKCINHSKCGKAANYFTKHTVHTKKIDKSNVKERIDYTFQGFFGLTFALGDMNNGWKEGSGDIFFKTVTGFSRIVACDKVISARLLPGLPQDLQVCSENYGVKEFGWKPYTRKNFSAKEVIEFYGLKKVSDRLAKLLTAQTKGKGLSIVTEKRAWQCMADTVAVFDKPSDQWTKADLEIVFTSVIDLVGIHATALKNWKYGDVMTSKYLIEFKPLLKIAGINIPNYKKDVLGKLKTCTRHNFNDVIISTQENDGDVDDDEEYTGTIGKEQNESPKGIFGFVVNFLNENVVSHAKTCLSLISKSYTQYRGRYEEIAPSTSLDNVARFITADVDLLNGWKEGAGDYFLKLSRGYMGTSLCYKPVCSRLAPKLSTESKEFCSKGYGSKDLGWNIFDGNYKSFDSIISGYGLTDISTEYDVLFKDYVSSSTSTKAGKRIVTYIGNTKKLFEIDVENWTTDHILAYFKNLINIFCTLTVHKNNKKEVTSNANEFISLITSLTQELNINTELKEYGTTEITSETSLDEESKAEFSYIWNINSSSSSDGAYEEGDDSENVDNENVEYIEYDDDDDEGDEDTD